MRIKREASPKPTESELDILHVLWVREACTVREVHDALYRSDGGGYTTALKLLQVMHAKGLVKRDDSQRAHVYSAAVTKEHAQRRFMTDMVRRVFEGSALKLVLNALGNHRASREELHAIRCLLDKLDKDAMS